MDLVSLVVVVVVRDCFLLLNLTFISSVLCQVADSGRIPRALFCQPRYDLYVVKVKHAEGPTIL